jgi:mannitol/fructose-specific phosphotransferase system IIA component (Ntr-type)
LTHAPILLDLKASGEEMALRELAELLNGNSAVVDPEKFWEAIWDRQCIQPPLLGDGIALPHARTAAVTEMVFAIARCEHPVPFGPDGDKVRLIFLYGVPPNQVTQSLAAVAQLIKKLCRPGVLKALLAAKDEAEFRNCLA